MGALEVVLAVAALLVGATGTWSPCGFSMVETIGPNGHTGGRGVTLAACATFLPGAIAGALVTFGGLALAGGVLHGPGGEVAYGIAAVVALAAAIAEARGARIAPQIRRQLPEHWRRVMPMPLAAALYGVLLGLGFTTFVLTFGVWALAGIALAVGEPAAGLAIGLGFGVGRALPIVGLAPVADRPAGRRAITLMAERPGLYRGIRLGDAVALTVAALALTSATATQADVRRAKPAADPSAVDTALVTQRGESRAAELRDGSGVTQLPGTDPAIGGSFIAVKQGPEVVLLARGDLAEVDRVRVEGADGLAVSGSWLAIRTRSRGRDKLQVRPLAPDGTIGRSRRVAAAGPPAQISRPSLAHDRVAYAVAKERRSRLVVYRIGDRRRRTVASSVRHGLFNPSIRGQKLLYVRSAKRRDELRLRDLEGGGDRKLKAGKIRMWSTALTGKRAYVTVLEGRAPRSRVISVRR
jgi:hypothetical protein